MTPRRLLATASAALAVAALTGCERPAPIVTVVSGTTSEWKEADVYCFDGEALDSGECAQRAEGPTEVPVASGQRIGIDVDRHVAERGWYIELAGEGGRGQSQRSDVMHDKHYFSFTAPQVGPDGLRLTVRSLTEGGDQDEASGEWVFDLVPR